jgi:hypothetical protein
MISVREFFIPFRTLCGFVKYKRSNGGLKKSRLIRNKIIFNIIYNMPGYKNEKYTNLEPQAAAGSCSLTDRFMSPGNTVCLAAVVAAICLAITIARRK